MDVNANISHPSTQDENCTSNRSRLKLISLSLPFDYQLHGGFKQTISFQARMPTLGDLNCSIELGRRNSLLREYGTLYGNKRVSCWICAPPPDINFSIHLASVGPNGFTAAPGLAMFVFIDGQYQCNRNITTIEEQKGAIDLRVRQKEEPTEGRRFIGRDWCCSPLITGHSYSATAFSLAY